MTLLSIPDDTRLQDLSDALERIGLRLTVDHTDQRKGHALQARREHRCAWPGCRELGVSSGGVHGRHDWFCRAHFAEAVR